MKTHVKFLTVITLLFLVLAGNIYAQTDHRDMFRSMVWHQIESMPDDFRIYDVEAQVIDIKGFGVSPMDVLTGAVTVPPEGLRLDMFFEGQTEGRITGAIKGTDYLTYYPDGSMELDVRATIETEDGYHIAVTIEGRTTPRLNEPISDITERATLSTMAEPYLWVNDLFIIGKGTSNAITQSLHVELFGFEKSGRWKQHNSFGPDF